MSKGKLQFDVWYVEPKSSRWDWAGLREKIAKHGLRNSPLVVLMPTTSTAQILGTFEPCAHNLYVRRVLADVFVQVNRHLLRDLIERALRIEDTRLQLMTHYGSVQLLPVPAELKELYKEVWEIKQHIVLDVAADRGKPQDFYDLDRKKLGEGSYGSSFKAKTGTPTRTSSS